MDFIYNNFPTVCLTTLIIVFAFVLKKSDFITNRSETTSYESNDELEEVVKVTLKFIEGHQMDDVLNRALAFLSKNEFDEYDIQYEIYYDQDKKPVYSLLLILDNYCEE